MNSLPQKSNDNFINKIKRLFIHIFNKKTYTTNIRQQEKNVEKNNINDIEKMREESKEKHLKEDIMKIIEKNPELIDKLTTKQLREMRKMYNKVIQENEVEILKLENKLKSLETDK